MTPKVLSSGKNKNTRNGSEEIANDNCMKFLSKYSSVISVSQATLHPGTFSNPRNGTIALLLFWAKFPVKLDCRWRKILRFVSEVHVAARFETFVSVCQEGSMRNDIYPD